MEEQEWLDILYRLEDNIHLNLENLFDNLKENIQKASFENYERWQENNFNINHMFKVKLELKNHDDESTLEMEEDDKYDDLTLLFLCVKHNLKHLVNLFIKVNSIDLSIFNKKGITLLHLAAIVGNLELAKVFADDKNLDINLTDVRGRTPLFHSAKNGHLDLVKYFVTKNADFQKSDKLKVTPLHKATENGHIEVVKFLVDDKNVSLLNGDSDNLTPLHFAASGGWFDILKYIIEEKNVDPDITDEDQWTPLSYAIIHNRIDIVKYLIEERQANVAFTTTSGGYTAVHLAAGYGNMYILKYLIEEKGMDFEILDEEQATPLHFAANSGYLEVVQYLIEKGANFRAVDKKLFSVVHHAASMGHVDILKYLIDDKNADFTEFDKNGLSPFALAIKHDHKGAVQYFYNKIGSTIVTEDGLNPLEFADKCDEPLIIVLLLKSEEKKIK